MSLILRRHVDDQAHEYQGPETTRTFRPGQQAQDPEQTGQTGLAQAQRSGTNISTHIRIPHGERKC